MATTFKEAEAKKWKTTVEGYNQEADALLKKVTDCIAAIREESEGPMVEALSQVASGLTQRFSELVSLLKELVVELGKIIDKFRELAGKVVEDIKGAAKKMVGGVDVSVSL